MSLDMALLPPSVDGDSSVSALEESRWNGSMVRQAILTEPGQHTWSDQDSPKPLSACLRWGIHTTRADGGMEWSETWTGGRVYLDNLIAALGSLPLGEQPEVVLIGDGPTIPIQQVAAGPCTEVKARSSHLTQTIRRMPKLRVLANLTYYRDVRPQLQNRIDFAFPCQSPFQLRAFSGSVAWIPDFQHIHLPQFFPAANRRARDRTFRQLAERAPIVVLSSHDAKKDFQRLYPEQGHKVRVLSFVTVPHAGAYNHNPREVAQKYNLPDLYAMIPNQFWVHKNHLCAFKALRRIKQHDKNLHLVCTGATHDYRSPHYFDELVTYLREHDLEDCVHILGLIPRSDQIQILRQAAIIIQPSLFEGWSTVVEDARAFGKRLIVSDLSVHREQNVDDAQYFDPRDPDMLAEFLLGELHSLTAGPDVDREAANRLAHERRTVSFAKAFIEIGREVALAR